MSKLRYRLYRPFMRLIHRYGFHYAPKGYPPEPHEVKIGLDGKPIVEWFHWCQWCGLRGKTTDFRSKS
jgi:hypothetical protein